MIWAIKWSRDRWCHVTPKVLWGSTVGYASDSLASCLIKELVVTQDDTRSHLQCTEAVYGDESEAVWQLHTTIQARGPEVSSTIDNFWYSLENLEILGNFLIPENCGNLKFTRGKIMLSQMMTVLCCLSTFLKAILIVWSFSFSLSQTWRCEHIVSNSCVIWLGDSD